MRSETDIAIALRRAQLDKGDHLRYALKRLRAVKAEEGRPFCHLETLQTLVDAARDLGRAEQQGEPVISLAHTSTLRVERALEKTVRAFWKRCAPSSVVKWPWPEVKWP